MSHLVHGMGPEPTAAVWAPLEDEELDVVLGAWGEQTSGARVTWRSPRPMSAAALVSWGSRRVFVKRHDERVRTRARLELEHRFSDHLLGGGVATPACLRTPSGASVVSFEASNYELFELAEGEDLYRDVPSWYPYLRPEHARSAGAALARLHRVASSFDERDEGAGVLSDGVTLISASEPRLALSARLATRPGLARALADHDVFGDVAEVLGAHLASAHEATEGLDPQWTHGDWHPSNLTWDDDGAVRAVLDLGLAGRTLALHDLAVAIERACIDWLDLHRSGGIGVDEDALDALLEGYDEVRPLDAGEREILAALLPVAHVDYALSEVEYFGDVLGDTADRDLAYDGYLLGHARFFESPPGRALLERVAGPKSR